MINRRFVLFLSLLAYSACSALEANIFSQGFEYFKNRIATLNDSTKETLRAAGVCTLVAGAVGSWVYFKKLTSRSSELTNKIKNIDVPTQPSFEDTCGYRALHTASKAYELHQQGYPSKDDAPKELAPVFMDEQILSDHLKNWKKVILIKRSTEVLKEYVKNHMLEAIAPLKESAPATYEPLRNALNNQIIQQFNFDSISKLTPLDIHQEELKKLFHNSLEHEIAQNEHVQSCLKNLPSFHLNQQLAQELIIDKCGNLNESLSGDEILAIAKQKYGNSIAENHFIVLENMQFLSSYMPQIIDWKKSTDGFLAFIIGTMKVQRGNYGHWFTLIAEKKDRAKSYYVADSIGTNRANNNNVLSIVEELEKPIASSQLNPRKEMANAVKLATRMQKFRGAVGKIA
ncbi:hypothetical protein HYX58_03430 [Candidatus Dependentiae bacterium]|nr:hypothetical protein [Candidatus Dependentiae bacterium]